jgi:putative ABC transport system ATP-binding protein
MTATATAPAPVIEVHGLTRHYDLGDTVVRALDGVDLTIEAGQLVAVMGTSGSGKSTLMNLLGCLDRPSAGTYLLEGVDVARLSRAALAELRGRRLGFVFQSFNLLARTSALDNVILPLLYQRVGRRERVARARAALDRVGLGSREDHRPSQLSGGQQQRVAIARALVTAPPIVFADEPTGNLDSRTSDEIMALLRGLADEGITVVLVTHEPDIAAWADRVLTMKDGKLVRDVMQAARRATPASTVAS